MTATAESRTFDVAAFRRAAEARDAAALLAMYTDDAEILMVDHEAQPKHPHELHGRAEISAFLDDLCGREMTHKLDHFVVGDGRAAYMETCVYPDGTEVLMTSVLDLRDGRIAKQSGVQAWDEETGGGKSVHKRFDKADEVRPFNNGRAELVRIGDREVGRLTLEPGWRWSNDVKPVAGTDLCQVAHCNYIVSGKIHIEMADGSSFEPKAGDVAYIPPGHDAWVLGKEPVVAIDWGAISGYAKQMEK